MEARVWEFVGTWRKPYRASSSIDLKPTEIEVLFLWALFHLLEIEVQGAGSPGSISEGFCMIGLYRTFWGHIPLFEGTGRVLEAQC